MNYTQVFGGTTIYPSDVTYLALALTADTVLDWPLNAGTGNDLVARIIDVTPTGAYSVIMPPADETGVGQTTQFTNLGPSTITIKDSDGGTIASIADGESWQVYLTDTSDAAGTWRTLQYGSTTSSAQAASLAGYGLTAIGSMLSQSIPTTLFNSNFTWTAASRASAYVWTGGLGTLTLPSAVAVGTNWFAMARNEGSGNLTIAPPGLETINSTASLTLAPGDSAIIFTDGSNFYTIGLGQDAVFAFDYTSIDLTGVSGNYTLSGSELNRIAYTFTGAISGNVEIVVPKTTQQYWVGNDTTGGSYTLRVRTSTQTPGVLVARGSRAILLCDGNNVLDAETGGIATPIAVADGGTGSTTAGGALINLGGTATGIALFTAASAAAARAGISAAASGANSDITSLSGLTTPLSVAQGGSGAATLTGILVGNGSGAFTAITQPSGSLVGTTATQTLTNKRITPRVNSTTTITSPLAWNSDNYDQYVATAQANALTINADAGTPTDGQKIMFRFTCDGSARIITFTGTTSNGFRPVGVAFTPSGSNFTYTLTASKTTYFGAIYNAGAARWDVVAVSQET